LLFNRPDISFYLLSEGFNLDWYQYYHSLILLEVEPFLYNPPVLDSIDSLTVATRRKASCSIISNHSANSVGPASETKRKYSFVEHWIETIQPEFDDEGYQFISIITREQCQEILTNKPAGSFILRPQESFADCQQFILSFRTTGTEILKHAVIRREDNPVYSSSRDNGAKKYFYKCGKLGPVNTLEGILHAISDIVTNPLVFVPVLPSFMSSDPANPGSHRDTEKAGKKEQNNNPEHSDTDSTAETFTTNEFVSFDINYCFWKSIQNLMPKLVNTVEMGSDLLGGHAHSDFGVIDEAYDENDDNMERASEDDLDEDNDDERDKEYVIHEFNKNNDKKQTQRPGDTKKQIRGLLRDLIENYSFKNISENSSSSVDRLWKLSLSDNDYSRLHQRLMSTLTMKQYCNQLYAFSNLLDHLWKYEIEIIDEQQEKLKFSSATPKQSVETAENDQADPTPPPCTLNDLQLKIVNLHSLKKAVCLSSEDSELNNSLLMLYFNSLMHENHYNTQLIQPGNSSPLSPINLRKKLENSGANLDGIGEGERRMLPPTLMKFPHQMLLSKGLLIPLISFYVCSERSLKKWIVPELFSVHQNHLQYHNSENQPAKKSFGETDSFMKKKNLLEKILATDISFSSYDKLSLSHLEDILSKALAVNSSSSSSASSGDSSLTLFGLSSRSSSSILSYEMFLMESLLLILYKHTNVKTVRFPGRRNGHGMTDFMLNDCVEINEFFNLLQKWFIQLLEVLTLLRMNLQGQKINNDGTVVIEADVSSDDEDDDDDLDDDLLPKAKKAPIPPTKKRTGHELQKIVFSKMDDNSDDEDREEAEDEEDDLSHPFSQHSLNSISTAQTETIDLRNDEQEKKEKEEALEEGRKATKEIEEKKSFFVKSKLFLNTKNDILSSETNSVASQANGNKNWSSLEKKRSSTPIEKILSKISKYWQQIVFHQKFRSHDASSNKYFSSSGSFRFENVTSTSSPHGSHSGASNLILDFFMIKVLLQTIYYLGLEKIPPLPAPSHSTTTAVAHPPVTNPSNYSSAHPFPHTETSNTREMTQRIVNWFFFHKAIIQMTKTTTELTPFSSAQTFYHYIDVWEVRKATALMIS
jgi:hypothetical protein